MSELLRRCVLEGPHGDHLWVSGRVPMRCPGALPPVADRPTPPWKSEVAINPRQLHREDVERWLLDQRATLWMDWDISKPERRALAIDWILNTFNELKGLER